MSGGYLVDTSVWHRSGLPVVSRRLVEAASAGRLYTCAVVLLEMGVSARNPDEHDRRLRQLRAAGQSLPITGQAEAAAVLVQRALAAKGYHRAAKIADLLIASVASVHGLTVLHYDSDFDLIAEVTGWNVEWVAERGSL